MERFPKCQPIVPLLRRAGVSVEQELEKLRLEADEYPERYRQLVAVRYYLNIVLYQCENLWNGEVAKGITNYKALLDQIERWRRKEKCVCLVTFNYDRLLEQALPIVGMQIRKLSDYIGSDTYKVIKPHGSIDWGREVKTPVTIQKKGSWEIAHELVDRAAELAVSQRYRLVADPYPIAHGGDCALFPALAIPVEKKVEYECPPDHLDALDRCITQVTKLLVIGWRATEYQFLKRLAGQLPRKLDFMVVAGSGEGSAEVGRRLHEAGIATEGRFFPYEHGFTEFVESRAGYDIVRA